MSIGPRIGGPGDEDFYARELKLRARAGQVMAELKAVGEDWQMHWRDHPIAREYRQLLKDVWEGSKR